MRNFTDIELQYLANGLVLYSYFLWVFHMPLSLIDIIALSIFFISWSGYTWFARNKAKTTDCLARSLNQHRIHWMYETIGREVRVAEAALLSNLERSIAFFASSTLLILAGILALFAQIETLESVIFSMPYADHVSHLPFR